MLPKGLIAVVRADSMSECRSILRGLIMAGIPTIELTMTVPKVLTLVEEFRSADATIGCGTALDSQSCQACINAGAQFVVSPVTDSSVLGVARSAGVPYVGGAMTPSEIMDSMKCGVDAVKIFPIGLVGGPKFLHALRGPFPEIRAVVSGGIVSSDFGAYAAYGAYAVCIGGELIDRAAAKAGNIDSISRRAQEVLNRINNVKEKLT